MLDKKLIRKILELQLQIEEENPSLRTYFSYCLGGLDADVSNVRNVEYLKVSAADYEDEKGNQKLEFYLKQLGMYLVQGAA